MIPMQDQTCTFRQAETLNKLIGFNLETQWYWMKDKLDKIMVVHVEHYDLAHAIKCYSAYSTTELGILLGDYIVMKYPFDNLYRVYDEYQMIKWIPNKYVSEPTARAEALIWLLQQKEIIPEELKL